MTVELKVPKTKTRGAAEAAGPKPVDLNKILDVDPLLQGQALLAANKKRKKQQKRAGKISYISCISIACCYVLKLNIISFFP